MQTLADLAVEHVFLCFICQQWGVWALVGHQTRPCPSLGLRKHVDRCLSMDILSGVIICKSSSARYKYLESNENVNLCGGPWPGLTYKRLNRLEDALDGFLKLHAILRNSSQVMFQLAHLYPCVLLLCGCH